MSSKWLLLLALACASAHAEPSASRPAEDDMVVLLQERGIIPRLNEVRHSVAEHTSELINTAMGMLGVPYRRGGSNAETGFDCSGFVRNIYSQVKGHLLPRVASEQAQATTKIEKRELQPGDLVFFNTMRRAFSHVGIYVGDGKFIHAPRTGASVRVEDMNSSYWAKRFNGARRVPLESAAEATPHMLAASQ